MSSLVIEGAVKQFFDAETVRRVYSTKGEAAHFFGYYDICPWSHCGTRLLVHRTAATGSYIRPADTVEVGLFDLKSHGAFVPLATTKACNWQQGAMLRWLGHSSDDLIFNDYDSEGYHARILSSGGEPVRRISAAVYDLSRDGCFGLSVAPERLWFTRRSYGYGREPAGDWAKPVVAGDGLRIVDLATSETRSLVDVRVLTRNQPLPSMAGAMHWLDHPLFSPDGRHVAFFHRWLTPAGAFLTRLYSCDTADGGNLFMYLDGGMYSHLTWRDTRNFVVFARPPGRDVRADAQSRSLREGLVCLGMPIYRRLKNLGFMRNLRSRYFNDRYFQFTLNSAEPTVIASSIAVDGHPSFCPIEPRVMLTDTYPDERGVQRLMLINAENGRVVTLAQLPVPRGIDNSSPNRCDLHPRWSRDGRKICIDSMHTGTRQMYVLELNDDLVSKLATA